MKHVTHLTGAFLAHVRGTVGGVRCSMYRYPPRPCLATTRRVVRPAQILTHKRRSCSTLSTAGVDHCPRVCPVPCNDTLHRDYDSQAHHLHHEEKDTTRHKGAALHTTPSTLHDAKERSLRPLLEALHTLQRRYSDAEVRLCFGGDAHVVELHTRLRGADRTSDWTTCARCPMPCDHTHEATRARHAAHTLPHTDTSSVCSLDDVLRELTSQIHSAPRKLDKSSEVPHVAVRSNAQGDHVCGVHTEVPTAMTAAAIQRIDESVCTGLVRGPVNSCAAHSTPTSAPIPPLVARYAAVLQRARPHVVLRVSFHPPSKHSRDRSDDDSHSSSSSASSFTCSSSTAMPHRPPARVCMSLMQSQSGNVCARVEGDYADTMTLTTRLYECAAQEATNSPDEIAAARAAVAAAVHTALVRACAQRPVHGLSDAPLLQTLLQHVMWQVHGIRPAQVDVAVSADLFAEPATRWLCAISVRLCMTSNMFKDTPGDIRSNNNINNNNNNNAPTDEDDNTRVSKKNARPCSERNSVPNENGMNHGHASKEHTDSYRYVEGDVECTIRAVPGQRDTTAHDLFAQKPPCVNSTTSVCTAHTSEATSDDTSSHLCGPVQAVDEPIVILLAKAEAASSSAAVTSAVCAVLQRHFAEWCDAAWLTRLRRVYDTCAHETTCHMWTDARAKRCGPARAHALQSCCSANRQPHSCVTHSTTTPSKTKPSTHTLTPCYPLDKTHSCVHQKSTSHEDEHTHTQEEHTHESKAHVPSSPVRRTTCLPQQQTNSPNLRAALVQALSAAGWRWTVHTQRLRMLDGNRLLTGDHLNRNYFMWHSTLTRITSPMRESDVLPSLCSPEMCETLPASRIFVATHRRRRTSECAAMAQALVSAVAGTTKAAETIRQCVREGWLTSAECGGAGTESATTLPLLLFPRPAVETDAVLRRVCPRAPCQDLTRLARMKEAMEDTDNREGDEAESSSSVRRAEEDTTQDCVDNNHDSNDNNKSNHHHHHHNNNNNLDGKQQSLDTIQLSGAVSGNQRETRAQGRVKEKQHITQARALDDSCMSVMAMYRAVAVHHVHWCNAHDESGRWALRESVMPTAQASRNIPDARSDGHTTPVCTPHDSTTPELHKAEESTHSDSYTVEEAEEAEEYYVAEIGLVRYSTAACTESGQDCAEETRESHSVSCDTSVIPTQSIVNFSSSSSSASASASASSVTLSCDHARGRAHTVPPLLAQDKEDEGSCAASMNVSCSHTPLVDVTAAKEYILLGAARHECEVGALFAAYCHMADDVWARGCHTLQTEAMQRFGSLRVRHEAKGNDSIHGSTESSSSSSSADFVCHEEGPKKRDEGSNEEADVHALLRRARRIRAALPAALAPHSPVTMLMHSLRDMLGLHCVLRRSVGARQPWHDFSSASSCSSAPTWMQGGWVMCGVTQPNAWPPLSQYNHDHNLVEEVRASSAAEACVGHDRNSLAPMCTRARAAYVAALAADPLEMHTADETRAHAEGDESTSHARCSPEPHESMTSVCVHPRRDDVKQSAGATTARWPPHRDYVLCRCLHASVTTSVLCGAHLIFHRLLRPYALTTTAADDVAEKESALCAATDLSAIHSHGLGNESHATQASPVNTHIQDKDNKHTIHDTSGDHTGVMRNDITLSLVSPSRLGALCAAVIREIRTGQAWTARLRLQHTASTHASEPHTQLCVATLEAVSATRCVELERVCGDGVVRALRRMMRCVHAELGTTSSPVSSGRSALGAGTADAMRDMAHVPVDLTHDLAGRRQTHENELTVLTRLCRRGLGLTLRCRTVREREDWRCELRLLTHARADADTTQPCASPAIENTCHVNNNNNNNNDNNNDAEDGRVLCVLASVRDSRKRTAMRTAARVALERHFGVDETDSNRTEPSSIDAEPRPNEDEDGVVDDYLAQSLCPVSDAMSGEEA